MVISAVIAAAGLSSRMRDFKPLLCLGDSTIIRHTIDTLRDAGVEKIIVVTGYQSAVLERHLNSAGVMFIKNERFARTDMLTSLKLGLRELDSSAEQVFVTPADIPLVSAETLKSMLAADGQVIRPSYNGRNGHPLLLRRDAVRCVLDWGGDDGLRGALRSASLQMTSLPVDDPGILMDADTPDDYKNLIRYQARLRGHGDLRMDLQLNIGMDELFLTTENVQLLDMIDQTGSLQNACSCMHISYSKGWKAVHTMEQQLGFLVTQRTSGGAYGGSSSLTEKGRELLNCYRRFHRILSEAAEKMFDQCFPVYLRSPENTKEDLE